MPTAKPIAGELELDALLLVEQRRLNLVKRTVLVQRTVELAAFRERREVGP